jgi:uncharacterized protein YdhG (YjbR/CyaY superfamily)
VLFEDLVLVQLLIAIYPGQLAAIIILDMKSMKQFNSVDEYINSVPEDLQKLLKLVRKTIKEVAPEANEKISYGVPTFTFHGNLVHYAAFKSHFSFFPTSSATKAFAKDLAPYNTSKGTIRFPLDKPLPLFLIRKIVEFRLKENLQRAKK